MIPVDQQMLNDVIHYKTDIMITIFCLTKCVSQLHFISSHNIVCYLDVNVNKSLLAHWVAPVVYA